MSAISRSNWVGLKSDEVMQTLKTTIVNKTGEAVKIDATKLIEESVLNVKFWADNSAISAKNLEKNLAVLTLHKKDNKITFASVFLPNTTTAIVPAQTLTLNFCHPAQINWDEEKQKS